MKLCHLIAIICLMSVAISLCGCGSSAPMQKVEQSKPEGKVKPAENPVAEELVVQTVETPMSSEIFLQSALNGETDTVSIALKNGMNANTMDDDGRTALMLAAFNGHKEIVSILIAAGAKVDTLDATGRNALMYASTGPNPDIAKTLIDCGVNVNVADSDEKWTALMFAAAEGCGDVVRVLLDNGADSSTKDVDGDNAATFARQRGHSDLADLLEKEK